jgi:hypothetical protein
MSRPQLEFDALKSGRIAARVGVIEIAEIIPPIAGGVVVYIVRLPLPSGDASRFRRANTLIEAKRSIWDIGSEWFIAAGVMDINCRLRCDERLSDQSVRRRRQ